MQKKSNSYRFLILLTLIFGVSPMFQSCRYDKEEKIQSFSKNFSKNVKILSSDEFEGRSPASPGGEKAIQFIENEFRRIGLKPYEGDSYRQAVPLIEITGSNFSALSVIDNKGSLYSFNYLDDMIVSTSRLDEKIELNGSEMVFAGYGIIAPEYGWNDYENIDVKGKTVVVLVNDPGYFTGNNDLFTGLAMTYYGRWTYKYEEAARQGASGVLIIHETGPAGYDWEVVRNSWSGPQLILGGDNNIPQVEVQGWIQKDAADKLFENLGMTLQEAKVMASGKDFKPFPMKMSASLSFDISHKSLLSYNVIGFIPGDKYPDESVIYMAHWDHLGKIIGSNGEVEIYNGAIDNSTGVAAIIALAEKFVKLKTRPSRSIIFAAVTAEESGLLGSLHYSQNPLLPLETTAGGINIDALNVYGPTHDVSIVGFNFTSLQNCLERQAKKQNRVLVPEKYPERGSFYRSDHFNLVRLGVPMIYANSGEDFIGKDEEYVKMINEDRESRYHSPNDVINDLWNWEGLDQNLWLFFNTGLELANCDSWPTWSETSEFRAVRQKSDAMRRKK